LTMAARRESAATVSETRAAGTENPEPGTGNQRTENPTASAMATASAVFTRTSLAMEARDENGFAEHVTVHRVDDGGARCGGFLGSALRHVELRVERVQLERVVMVRTRRRAGAHVRIRSQADLTAAVGQL